MVGALRRLLNRYLEEIFKPFHRKVVWMDLSIMFSNAWKCKGKGCALRLSPSPMLLIQMKGYVSVAPILRFDRLQGVQNEVLVIASAKLSSPVCQTFMSRRSFKRFRVGA